MVSGYINDTDNWYLVDKRAFYKVRVRIRALEQREVAINSLKQYWRKEDRG